jgi:hypothetical protein
LVGKQQRSKQLHHRNPIIILISLILCGVGVLGSLGPMYKISIDGPQHKQTKNVGTDSRESIAQKTQDIAQNI